MPATATRADRSPRAAEPSPRGGRMGALWRVLEGPRALDVAALLIGVCTAVLTVLGLVMVLSSSSVEAIGSTDGSYGLFRRQAMWAVGGLAALLVLRRLPLRVLKGLAWPAFGLAFLLLSLVAFTSLGHSVGGNTNWLRIGGFTMQPSEAAKLAMALWAAAVLERKGRLIRHVHHALVPVLPFGLVLVVLVLLGRDLGTAIILTGILATILFIAGTNRKVFIAFAALAATVATAMVRFAKNRLVRVQAWLFGCEGLETSGDPCFQPDHGIYALASGGWWGVGLGQSRQKWSYIPEAENDFIFTILGEELGLVGSLAVLAAFLGLAVGMYALATRTTSPFIRLATWGVMAWLVGQAFVNIAMVTGLLPVIGVPLPFISYGGSALTLALAGVGVVLAFARHEREALRREGAPDAPTPDPSVRPQETR